VRVWRPSTGVCEAVVEGHTVMVTALVVLPDGRLASGSDDKTVRVWRPSTGVCEAVLEGHTDWVHALVVLPDGLFACGEEQDEGGGQIRVWS
jgi:WD40 repeat protein